MELRTGKRDSAGQTRKRVRTRDRSRGRAEDQQTWRENRTETDQGGQRWIREDRAEGERREEESERRKGGRERKREREGRRQKREPDTFGHL